jgi:hypothetical protein
MIAGTLAKATIHRANSGRGTCDNPPLLGTTQGRRTRERDTKIAVFAAQDLFEDEELQLEREVSLQIGCRYSQTVILARRPVVRTGT